MNQSVLSLPKFMKLNNCSVSYAVACSMAKYGTLPGVFKSPSGFGWIVKDSQSALCALSKEKTNA